MSDWWTELQDRVAKFERPDFHDATIQKHTEYFGQLHLRSPTGAWSLYLRLQGTEDLKHSVNYVRNAEFQFWALSSDALRDYMMWESCLLKDEFLLQTQQREALLRHLRSIQDPLRWTLELGSYEVIVTSTESRQPAFKELTRVLWDCPHWANMTVRVNQDRDEIRFCFDRQLPDLGDWMAALCVSYHVGYESAQETVQKARVAVTKATLALAEAQAALARAEAHAATFGGGDV